MQQYVHVDHAAVHMRIACAYAFLPDHYVHCTSIIMYNVHNGQRVGISNTQVHRSIIHKNISLH